MRFVPYKHHQAYATQHLNIIDRLHSLNLSLMLFVGYICVLMPFLIHLVVSWALLVFLVLVDVAWSLDFDLNQCYCLCVEDCIYIWHFKRKQKCIILYYTKHFFGIIYAFYIYFRAKTKVFTLRTNCFIASIKVRSFNVYTKTFGDQQFDWNESKICMF